IRVPLRSCGTKNGNGNTVTRFGNRRRTSFRFLARRFLCKRLITFISTLCGRDWSSEQSTIAGRAQEFGTDVNWKMNLCRLIVIGSNGGGHSPLGSWEVLSEGRRPSAHRAAKPQAL